VTYLVHRPPNKLSVFEIARRRAMPSVVRPCGSSRPTAKPTPPSSRLPSAQFDEYRRTVAMLAKADNRRLGRDPDDFEVRVFFGALAGGLMAVLERPSDVAKRVLQALDFIEAGMPLK
jgi:MftR C-terminal domain